MCMEDMRIYCINGRGQPTMGGPSAIVLGKGVPISHRKKLTWYEILNGTSYLDRFFGTGGRAVLDSSGSG